MMKENKLSTFFSWFLVGSALLLPVFLCPFIINPLSNSKLLLAFLIAFVAAFSFVATSVQRKSWKIVQTPFTLPLFAFAVLVIISSLVSHQYPNKQLLGLGGAYFAFAALIILAPTLIREKISKHLALALNLAALILSVLSIFQVFGLGIGPLINKFSVLGFPNNLSFSLSGATFVAIQFLSVILLSNVLDHKSWQNSLFNKITTLLIAVALGINIWAILPSGEAKFQLLSLTSSVNIAKNSMALTKNALFGYGPDSYGNAYNILKPLSINGLDYWQFTFDSAFNFPLTLLVSSGLIASLVYLVFLIKVFITVKNQNDSEIFLRVFILASFVWQFFAPLNLVMLFLLAIVLAVFVSNKQDKYKKISFTPSALTDFLDRNKWAKTRNLVFMIGNASFILLLGFALYFSARNFAAYRMLYKSSLSISKNEIAKAYDYHKSAKILSPQLAFIRRSYSLLNLQIAIALSNKANISPAEQEQVLQLVNQAISEAKAATILDPTNYQNWSVLAQIYMQLLDTTDQAQQEAFNSLAKAASYNPSNPEIRIVLGQLFFNKQKYTEAITFFNQAIEKKPDMFLAYYYLAQAQIANNQLSEAKSSMITGLNLLKKDGEEYKKVEKELNSLINKIELNIDKEETASESADLIPNSTDSNISNLLDQQDAETLIQDNALSTDQSLIEN